jgi:hypothetical protein
MEGIHWIILATMVLPIVWAVTSAAGAQNTQKKFAALGALKGRTKDEIVEEVGLPNSVSLVGANKELLQWQRPGYHIALLFTDGVCEGVSHEHSA